LHFLRWRAADGVKVSNHLKFIAERYLQLQSCLMR
jgi:hypothetical protein